jgi:hypothetical protein
VFSRGYLTLFRIRGVPVKAHWSIPLVALFMSGFRFLPGVWVGVVLLILWHEIGHLFFVLRYGLRAMSVEVNGFGGLCRYTGTPTPVQRSVIAWGGVVFQMIALVAALIIGNFVVEPESAFGTQLYDTFFRLNLLLAGLNLIPIPPFDGAEAWKLFGRLKSQKKPPRRQRRVKPKPRPDTRHRGAGKVVDIKRRADGKEVIVVDEDDVKDTVREALERAAKEARDKRQN